MSSAPPKTLFVVRHIESDDDDLGRIFDTREQAERDRWSYHNPINLELYEYRLVEVKDE